MVCVTFVVFGAVAIAAGLLGVWINGSPRTPIWLSRISGFVFVSLAFKLATTKSSLIVAVGLGCDQPLDPLCTMVGNGPSATFMGK